MDMASVKPFCGLRPINTVVEKVASLPYDVLDSEEARAVTKENPYSFLRVTKSEVDLPEGIAVNSPLVYDKAKENLREFIEKGILVQDEQPCFYIYRQQMGSHIQVGLVAAVSVEEYKANKIRRHELTRPDKEQDRVDHILATQAQTGAVFLTYKANETINAILSQCMAKAPVYDFTAEDGVKHTFYVIDEKAKLTAIEQAFSRIETLYIADGHHRSAAAARVYDLCRENNPQHTGEEPYNRFLAVIFPHTMMQILDYNRIITDLNGLTEREFLEKVQERFDIAPCTRVSCKSEYPHYFGMYMDHAWYKLVAKEHVFNANDPMDRLDVTILQKNLLEPVLGIQDPRTDKRIQFVGGIRGIAELERLVDDGQYKVAFSMYPTSIKELFAIADANLIMPPKSTWFEPKLRDAMVVHLTPCRLEGN
jgi:uncharacterized protein (DUF1015 family)